MNKKLIAASGLGLVALALMAKDPIIMTVNGVDVPKSEFEYLYGKNSQQQLNQQPLEEYVEMFKLYKMKVADAKAEGIDTTASFQKEIEQYRRDLASPYLADSVYMNKLLDEMYDRAQQEVEARHIMVFKSETSNENDKKLARIDSIHKALLAGADFAELANKVSEDRGSNTKGGYMGYITAQQYPYTFEVAAYSTPEGEISEIVESPVGYHILLGGKRRPASGKVQAAHILKLVKEGDAEEDAAAHHVIDSLYNVVKNNPADFADVATKYSDDKGSARQGGMLPLFSRGEMVQPFDSIAFAMDDNTISEPFRTRFGWHIINKLGRKGIPSKDQMKPQFMHRITTPQDDRFMMLRDNQTKQLAGRHKSKVNEKTLASVHELSLLQISEPTRR
ncbi:MAG: peptidylprolyl isomerase, partial [Muribaculaceae bacterium]|nr:peptidylprolyl isomerase [Muribaculaceae bacterium]